VGLIEFTHPEQDVIYRFNAMYCRDRDNAACIRCDRIDTAGEEWVLFGRELTEMEITKIMEERWLTPLKITKPEMPLENTQEIHFTRRAPDEEEENENGVSAMAMDGPLELFRDLSN
jgi:hypothetical protein